LLNSWNSNKVGNTTYPGCEQWKITYPTGDEEKDLCSNISNNRKEFYYAKGNSIVFRAPIRDDNGTTPNSDNVRCELREREVDGGSDVYWTTSGNHVIYVKQAITNLPIRKPHLVATQIHGNKSEGIDDAMVVRLENKKLFLSFNGGKLRSDVTIKTNYNLGTVHEVIFQVIDGKHYCYYSENGNLKSAFANGNADQYLVKDGSNAVLMNRNYGDAYFKAGNYTQSNPDQEGSDTGKSNNYGEVILYDLYVDHNGNSTPGGNNGGSTCNSSAVPSNRHIDNIGQNSATFDWNSVANIDHYNVRWRQKGTSSWSYKTSIRNTTQHTVSNLKSNTTYEWQMRSKCPDGSGAAYSQGQGPDFKTSSSSSTCNSSAVPSNRHVDNIGQTSATLDWNSVANIDHYNVRWRQKGTSSWSYKTSIRNTTQHTVSNLKSNTTYEWQMRSKCPNGAGAAYSKGQGPDFKTNGSSSGSKKIVIITKRNAPGFAIDGKGGGANGQNVHLWTTNPNNGNQQWVEIDRGNGYYSYQKNNTNFCLDGNGGGANGQNVHLWTCNSNNQNQHWKKQSTSGGAYKLIKRNAQGFAINGGSGGSKGQNVNLYNSSNGSYNLQWFVTTLSSNHVQATTAETTIQTDVDKEALENSVFKPEIQNSTFDDTSDATVISQSEDLVIYPNPVKDLFTIQVKDLNESSEIGLEIIELSTGRVIHKDSYKQSLIEFDSSSFMSGTYVVRILHVDGRHVVKKMVKM
jgi:hypothetical protein